MSQSPAPLETVSIAMRRSFAVIGLPFLLLLLLVGCQGGSLPGGAGGGAIRDEHLKAESILRGVPVGGVGADIRLNGVNNAWYSEAMQAQGRWPNASDINSRVLRYYESPERDSPLDIPELLLLLGALHRSGYVDLPVKTYVDVLMLRLFAHDVTFFPDPTQEDPAGIPLNELLRDAHSAMGPALRTPLKARLESTLGRNPGAFSPREARWALRLIEGETGQLQSSPEELYHRLCLAAITHNQTALRPAFEAAAKDHTNVATFRFSSLVAAYLLASDRVAAGQVFAERLWGDRYLPEVYSYEAYRVMASQQDPLLYAAIKTALDKLPATQHVDYGEFLARYGKPEDLPTVLALIDAPHDSVDLQLTVAHSPELLNPVTPDPLAATASDAAISARLGLADSLAGKPATGTIPAIPGDFTTNARSAQALADTLGVPVSQLLPAPLTPGDLQARRLWWLRFFPPDLVRDELATALAKGSDAEKLAALRMLGLYGGAQALPIISKAFSAKSTAIRQEAALWYLAGWQAYQANQSQPAAPESETPSGGG